MKFSADKIILILFSVMIINSCSDKMQTMDTEIILARIGDKTISLNEFIRRAEYTTRPAFCRGSNIIHKKIILNSLIAEKLLALESEKSNLLDENQEFKDYLKGRQQQALRQLFYQDKFYSKTVPAATAVKTKMELCQRKYDINYFTIDNKAAADAVKRDLDKGRSFSEVYRQLGGLNEIPTRKILWNKAEHENIRRSMYARPYHKNEIIGPINSTDGSFTFIKIKGWTRSVLLTDSQIRQARVDVSEQIKEDISLDRYEEYISNLMRGKKINFNGKTLTTLVNLLGPWYIKSAAEKKAMFNASFWQKASEKMPGDSTADKLLQIADYSLFNYDGDVWSTADFMRELNVHPLVFRKRKINQNEFGNQFKLAIVDMIRDREIARAAARAGYAEAAVVRRNVSMWRDNFLALYQKNQFLDKISRKNEYYSNFQPIVEKELNPYIQSLYAKYDSLIEINTDSFAKIELSEVDMVVLQRNSPFPIVVPTFPVLTTHAKLDYGRKMN